jgi:cyclophilin family peptidyl-prolyl cis-trans isomerase
MRKNIILGLLLIFVLSGCQSNSLSQEQSSLSLSGQNLGSNLVKTPRPSVTPAPSFNSSPVATVSSEKANQVVLSLKSGSVVIELFPDKAPGTVKNFLAKAASGYYDNLIFHRVEDWVVQGGDPLGNGTGGGEMPTELSNLPFVRGSVGVARGADIKVSNDSQFFICTKDCPWLTGKYTNFGRVVKGMELVDKIQVNDPIITIKAKVNPVAYPSEESR